MNCKDWSKSDLELENGSLTLPSEVHANSYPYLDTGGGGGDGPLPRSLRYFETILP